MAPSDYTGWTPERIRGEIRYLAGKQATHEAREREARQQAEKYRALVAAAEMALTVAERACEGCDAPAGEPCAPHCLSRS